MWTWNVVTCKRSLGLQWEIKKFLDQPMTPTAGTLDLITNHCFTSKDVNAVLFYVYVDNLFFLLKFYAKKGAFRWKDQKVISASLFNALLQIRAPPLRRKPVKKRARTVIGGNVVNVYIYFGGILCLFSCFMSESLRVCWFTFSLKTNIYLWSW